MAKSMPPGTYDMLKEAGLLPRSIDREIVEAMHRVHMGVGADYRSILSHGVRASLGDGWGGSMIGTEISDVMFGTPRHQEDQGEPGRSEAGSGEHLAARSQSGPLGDGGQGRDIAGDEDAGGGGRAPRASTWWGCAAPATNCSCARECRRPETISSQELVITTGALEMMIVDYQCIFPSLPHTAACYHTKVVTTSPKAKIPGRDVPGGHPGERLRAGQAHGGDSRGQLQEPR